MRLAELANRFSGSVAFVVGTGPSARVMPPAVLNGAPCVIGLNRAWVTHPCHFSLTVHPELILEYEAASRPKNKTAWITKPKPPMEHLHDDHPDYYVFRSTENPIVIGDKKSNELFVGRGIQTAGIDLAIRMGAKLVILIGVDMGTLGGHHHSSNQHVRFNGLQAKDVYREYYEWTSFVRDVAFRMGVPVLSLSAVLGEAWRGEDYKHLCDMMKLPPLPVPKDTSYYTRQRTDPPPKL